MKNSFPSRYPPLGSTLHGLHFRVKNEYFVRTSVNQVHHVDRFGSDLLTLCLGGSLCSVSGFGMQRVSSQKSL